MNTLKWPQKPKESIDPEQVANQLHDLEEPTIRYHPGQLLSAGADLIEEAWPGTEESF